ncbi:MAG: cation-translocating P-type ATPase, partial [Lachnospiraceae bacterium]|nr:cation-translocating P-type ATPase [Lachnospiraceae bacterium]
MDKDYSQAGLSKTEVEERIKNGLVNDNCNVKTKSIGQIIRSNVFTLFNGVNVLLAILVCIVGSYKNMLFMGVVLSNIIIGVVQEIRSKRV